MCISLKMFAEINKNEGIVQGVLKGKVSILIDQLKYKFRDLSEESIELINQCDEEKIEELRKYEEEIKNILKLKMV